jgi:formate-dependent nitrite reductase cytochrome c552 subunit
MAEHQHIRLEHGDNRFCLNCHNPTNRNAFVDYDGAEIAEADVALVCAKCHGPTYRDWKAGAHGRRNGFWGTRQGPQTRLQCIQCHDPHRPRFQPMKPLAPLKYPARGADAPREIRSPKSERAGPARH